MIDDDLRRLFPIRRLHAFHPDANINFQLNRFLIPGEEAAFAEMGRTMKDFADWKRGFFRSAKEREEQGDLRAAAGFYEAAEFFISPSDPDRRVAYEKFHDLFYRAAPQALAARIAIPYAGGSLHGLHLKARGARRGTIVVHAGFDAYIESFLGVGEVGAAAGYDMVLFDGPGQGSTLMRGHMPMTAQWEKPVAAVLDHLALDDVTLIGISLGGYLALRAAAFEPRVKRVIAFDVMFDFFQCIVSRRGRLAELLLTLLVKARADPLLDLMARTLMRIDPYSRWGLQQGMHVCGASSPAEFLVELKAYTMRGISGRLTQDVLVLAGAEDHFVPLAQFHEQLRELCNVRSLTGRVYTRAEQAQSHCQVGNLALAVREMMAWIESRRAPAHADADGPLALRQAQPAPARRGCAP